MTTIRESLEILGSGWPQPWTPQAVALFAEHLSDIEPDELLDAVDRLIRAGGEWRPSIGTIRRAVADGRGIVPLDAEAADQRRVLDDWDTARSVPWGAQAAPDCPEVHPSVFDAWKIVGPYASDEAWGFAWRESKERFVRNYVEGSMNLPMLEGGGDVAAIG